MRKKERRGAIAGLLWKCLRADLIEVKDAEGEITFDTRDIERAGYYALRVIQGDSVKNITIMKRKRSPQ